jgi:hypothetical protein
MPTRMGEPQFIEQAYRFALRPTREQELFLTACTGASRFFYDWGLALVATRLRLRRAYGPSIAVPWSYKEQMKTRSDRDSLAFTIPQSEHVFEEGRNGPPTPNARGATDPEAVGPDGRPPRTAKAHSTGHPDVEETAALAA